MALINSMTGSLQERKLLPINIFCDGDIASSFGVKKPHPLDAILSDCGKKLIAIWNSLVVHVSSSSELQGPFSTYDVPVFQIIRDHNQTVREWQSSTAGLSSMSMYYSLIKPEMAGCIEPTLLVCNEMVDTGGFTGKTYKAVPVPERIKHLAKRTAQLQILKSKANSEKKLR